MELNYNIILDYLYKPTKNDMIEKKINISEKIDNSFFNEIFDNSFYKYGVYKNDDNNNNISLLTSILYCMDEKYKCYTMDDINNLCKYYASTIGSTTNGSTTIGSTNGSTNGSNSTTSGFTFDNFLKIFDINFIVFNYIDGNISSCYNGDYFNPWKPTIYLAYDNIYYDPIVTKETRLFSYSSPKSQILKNKILLETIVYNVNSVEKKDFFVNDNIHEILENENLTNNNISETFTTHYDITKNITLNKLNKMKKNDIMKLLDELNLNIDKPKATKKDLIDIICNQYNIS